MYRVKLWRISTYVHALKTCVLYRYSQYHIIIPLRDRHKERKRERDSESKNKRIVTHILCKLHWDL